MKRLSLISLGVALAVLVPGVASAAVEHEAIEEKKLASGKQKIAPDKGYVFLHGPERAAFVLIKEPTPAEIAAFEEERRTELADAIRKYPRTVERWERDVEFARSTRSDRIPERPIEPNEANFSIGPLETRNLVSIGPTDPFSKGEGYFSYLHELEPGTYRYYGPILSVPNASLTGTCFCMGSVKFEVKPGSITNLGDFLTLEWASKEQGLASNVEWQRATPPQPTDYSLPPRLAAFANQQAAWRAAGKIDNFFGLMIGRIPPVPEILAYERDRIIDLKAANAGSAGSP